MAQRPGVTIFPKSKIGLAIGSPSQLSDGSFTTIATNTPKLELSTATTSPSYSNFSPATSIMQSPVLALRPKTAGVDGENGLRIRNGQTRQQWADTMMTGSPIEIITDDNTYAFPTPIRRPSTALNSANGSPNPAVSMFPPPVSNEVSSRPSTPLERAYWWPTLANASIEDEQLMRNKDKTWPPARGPGSKPARAHTTKDFISGDSPERPKLSRWRSLGGLFTKKKSDTSPIEPSRSMADLKGEAAKEEAKTISTELESDQKQAPPGGILRNFTKMAKHAGDKRPKTRDGKKDKNEMSEPLKLAPKSPFLDVQIPEIHMERYSQILQEVQAQGRPTRSSSLQARRMINRGGPSKTLELTRNKHLGHIRSATEPSPRSPLTPMSSLQHPVPEDATSSSIHISSLMDRPRPIKRTNTAPPTLPSVDPRGQKLSPAFEADEMDYDDKDRLTPTPSEPSSPTTPKSLPNDSNITTSLSPLEPPRKLSWDQSTSHSNDSAYEIITIGKRISENDILPGPKVLTAVALSQLAKPSPLKSPPPPISKDKPAMVAKPMKPPTLPMSVHASQKPRLETAIPPRMEVAVARTHSLKRTDSARKIVVRAPSVKSNVNPVQQKTAVANALISAGATSESTAHKNIPRIITPDSTPHILAATSFASKSAPLPPIPQSYLQTKPQEQHPSRPLLQSTYSLASQSRPSLSRKESNRLEIKKEIWGAPKIKINEVKETRSLLKPAMFVVDQDETRRSVVGTIETA